MNLALALAVAGLAFSAASVLRHLAGGGDRDMDVVGLKDAAEVGLVRLALAQALEGGFLVAEGLQEEIRKLRGVEWPLGERGNGLLDFDGVHASGLHREGPSDEPD